MSSLQFLKNGIQQLLVRIVPGRSTLEVTNYDDKPILQQQEGNDLIARMLTSPEPCMVARLGRVELNCLINHLLVGGPGQSGYKRRARREMTTNAGFFPATNEMLDRFCTEFLCDLALADIIGVWFNAGEERICSSYCPDARLVRLRSLEPYYHEQPWSSSLEGRNVLVIHPFAGTIEAQYARNRELLFADPAILPPFHLETIQAVQTIAGAESPFASWFDAYDYMCTEMEKKDFDIAIIGAGAYGLPLAAYAKKLGKKAIHLGGATQILFGIKGKRWDNHEVIATLYNDYWTRPTADETPNNSRAVEGGCYW
jgi:hypothetical protein